MSMVNEIKSEDKFWFEDNPFSLFFYYCDYLDILREKCEEEISVFIDEEWNPNLEYYVECENYKITIMVAEEIDNESFEIFIIKPLCENYNLTINYVEIVESEFPYIEWGLVLDEKK